MKRWLLFCRSIVFTDETSKGVKTASPFVWASNDPLSRDGGSTVGMKPQNLTSKNPKEQELKEEAEKIFLGQSRDKAGKTKTPSMPCLLGFLIGANCLGFQRNLSNVILSRFCFISTLNSN